MRVEHGRGRGRAAAAVRGAAAVSPLLALVEGSIGLDEALVGQVVVRVAVNIVRIVVHVALFRVALVVLWVRLDPETGSCLTVVMVVMVMLGNFVVYKLAGDVVVVDVVATALIGVGEFHVGEGG